MKNIDNNSKLIDVICKDNDIKKKDIATILGYTSYSSFKNAEWSNNIPQKRIDKLAERYGYKKVYIQIDSKDTETHLEKIKKENEERKSLTKSEKQKERFIKLCKKVEFPFQSIEFKNLWLQWMIYKAGEYGFSWKTEQGIKAQLIRVSNLADGNEEKAIKIIQQSIQNGWRGFFELKTKNNGKQENGISQDYVDGLAKDLLD